MPAYRIPRDRTSFIEEHFFQWSLNLPEGSAPSKDLFLQLSHPADLHYLADIYNWDDGSLVLRWILESPLCSRSTANLIFWRAAPDYYLGFDLNDIESCPGYNREAFYVLALIVQRYHSGSFSEIDIDFDPDPEIEEIMTEEPKWEIPDGVYDRIHGLTLQLA